MLCVSPSGIFTQRDDEDLAVTNTYALLGDCDIEGISPGKGEEELVLQCRADKKAS